MKEIWPTKNCSGKPALNNCQLRHSCRRQGCGSLWIHIWLHCKACDENHKRVIGCIDTRLQLGSCEARMAADTPFIASLPLTQQMWVTES